MEQPKRTTGKSERDVSSSSSVIARPTRNESTDTTTDTPNNYEMRRDEEGLPPVTPRSTNPLVVIWMSVFACWRMVAGCLYDSTVGFVSGFVADVISQPRLRGILIDVVVTAINAFMDQDDIGTKIDDTARRVIYDTDKAREASHALGKEVVPMVAGFVGGVAHSLKPSVMKRRKKKRSVAAADQKRKSTAEAHRTSDQFASDLTTNSQRTH